MRLWPIYTDRSAPPIEMTDDFLAGRTLQWPRTVSGERRCLKAGWRMLALSSHPDAEARMPLAWCKDQPLRMRRGAGRCQLEAVQRSKERYGLWVY